MRLSLADFRQTPNFNRAYRLLERSTRSWQRSFKRKKFYDAYVGKTYKRIEKIQKLVPFADKESIVINGKKCRNIFYCKEKTEKMIEKYLPKEFKFIHGDPTFSNILLRDDAEPVLIDLRGYFADVKFYGDPASMKLFWQANFMKIIWAKNITK